MKDFFIRFISGLVILCILLFIAPLLNIKWVQEGHSGRMFIAPIALAGGWVSLYLYKAIKKKKEIKDMSNTSRLSIAFSY